MRKAVSKKTRFEVFKRDAFKCQYCGKGAPEVILHVDHIQPVAKGGGNDLLNLITACIDCNAGKGARELSDDRAIVKQRAQLDELSERREQQEMLVAWRNGLNDIAEQAVQHAVDAFNAVSDNTVTVNDRGRATLRKLIRQHGLSNVLEAISIARTQYVEVNADGSFTTESVQLAFTKVPGICRYKNISEDEKRLFYIRGICRNRFDRCVDWECLQLLKNAHAEGASIEYLTKLTLDTARWSTWKRWLGEVIEEHRADQEFPDWRNDAELAAQRGARLGVHANPGESLGEYVVRIQIAMNGPG